MRKLFLYILAIALLQSQSASSQQVSIISPRDRQIIEGNLGAEGYADIIVDLASPPELTTSQDSERVEQTARLINEFLNRYRSLAVQGRLLYTPTFATRITYETYDLLRNARGISRMTPNTPLVSRQVSPPSPEPHDLSVTGTVGRSLSLVGANNPLMTGAGGRSQIVAVIDTGVDAKHSVFAGRIIDGHCFSTANSDYETLCADGVTEASGVEAARPCAVRPACDHGTAVASIVAGYGVTPEYPGPYDIATVSQLGVAPLSYLYPIMVMSSPINGDSPVALTFDLRRALQRVYQQRNSYPGNTIVGVNVSLNASALLSSTPCNNDPLATDIALLRNANIATVISAGNTGDRTNVAWPACITDAIVVASSDANDQPSAFSNFADLVDFFAPGETVDVAVPSNKVDEKQIGTSFAAPHVTGAIALLRSVSNSISLAEIERRLRANGKPVRVGNNTRPRIQVDQAAASMTPGLINWSPTALNIIAGSGFTNFYTMGLRTPRGSAAWELVEKPNWLDVSGRSGVTPDEPVIRIWLNAEADSLPEKHQGVLRIRNKTVAQSEIVIPVTFSRVKSAGGSLRIARLNGYGVLLERLRADLLQADVIVTNDNKAFVVNLGFPPDNISGSWSHMAIKSNGVQTDWEFRDLPRTLTPSQISGSLGPDNFENRVSFSVRAEEAKDLMPGNSFKQRFSIVDRKDSNTRIPLEFELYVHKPPSDYFQVAPMDGILFMGSVGGPFSALQPVLEVRKVSGEVRWELSNVPGWLTVSEQNGAAPSTLRFSINEKAKMLPLGVYSAHIVFRNMSGFQQPINRVVSLVVSQR